MEATKYGSAYVYASCFHGDINNLELVTVDLEGEGRDETSKPPSSLDRFTVRFQIFIK